MFDGEQRLAYRGQFDDSRPANHLPVTGADLVAAVDALLAGGTVADGPGPQHRLQHQVAGRQRAGLLRLKRPVEEGDDPVLPGEDLPQ